MTFQLSLDERMTERRASMEFLMKENQTAYLDLIVWESYIGQFGVLDLVRIIVYQGFAT